MYCSTKCRTPISPSTSPGCARRAKRNPNTPTLSSNSHATEPTRTRRPAREARPPDLFRRFRRRRDAGRDFWDPAGDLVRDRLSFVAQLEPTAVEPEATVAKFTSEPEATVAKFTAAEPEVAVAKFTAAESTKAPAEAASAKVRPTKAVTEATSAAKGRHTQRRAAHGHRPRDQTNRYLAHHDAPPLLGDAPLSLYE